MANINELNIDDATITQLGLRLTDNTINANIAPDARVFEYPHLVDVFVMESDLYGNLMPKDSCFLAFNGARGLMGKHLKVESLKNLSVEEIRLMVEANTEG